MSRNLAKTTGLPTSRSFEVELQPTLDETGSLGARIRPVTVASTLFADGGLKISDAVLDAISDLLADIARQDQNDAADSTDVVVGT